MRLGTSMPGITVTTVTQRHSSVGRVSLFSFSLVRRQAPDALSRRLVNAPLFRNY